MSAFPSLKVEPGRYAVRWFVEDRVVPGEVEVEGIRPPTLTLFDDVKVIDWFAGVNLPLDHERDWLVGRLRSNEDIVVRNASLSTWHPGLCVGHGQYAVVGLGVADGDERKYARIRFQLNRS